MKTYRAAGFTFVEVLIVTAILAVITAAIFPIIYQGQYTYQSEKRVLEATHQARVTTDQIVRYVRQSGNNPLETAPVAAFPPIEILQASPAHIRINSDITGSVASTTGNPKESTGDPDGTLNSVYERVTVRHDTTGVNRVLIDVGYGEEVVAENIPTLNFTFFDASGNPTTNPNAVARTKVQMVVQTNLADPKTGKISSVTLESDVFIRNKSWELFQ